MSEIEDAQNNPAPGLTARDLLMHIRDMDRVMLLRSLVLGLFAVGILWGCLLVLKPFIPALLLAAIFCLSTWPAFQWFQMRTGHRTTLSATIMTLLLAVCFLVPLIFLGSSLADNFTSIFRMIAATLQQNPGHAPLWIAELPLIGDYIDQFWREYLTDTSQIAAMMTSNLQKVTPYLLKIGTSIGRGLVDIAFGVLIAFFFFRHGTVVLARISALAERFLGARGQHYLNVSKKTTIGVVYGILGTAIAQGALAGVGFWIAGIPAAPFLGLVTFLISLVPFGPPLIWIPATLWLFGEGQTGMAVFMGIWGLCVISGVDNIIRPYFISLGSNLPLLLVLLGVFGGIIAFGFIGIFIGPTLLALTYTLIIEWSHTDRTDDPVIAPE